MNGFVIVYTLGNYLLLYALCFLPSFCIAWGSGEWMMMGIFGAIIASTLFVGASMSLTTRKEGKEAYFTKKEGLFTVSLIWIISGLIGAIPFYASGWIGQPISAIFESVSGFTTTGASVLTEIEALPQSLLFWRSFTHWLGGLGIVVLFVAILPYLGVGGRTLFRSEVPGPEADVIKPKVRETAFTLLKIYATFTIVESTLLFFCGMSVFDAFCHTFGTLATGGFSTKNTSIAHFDSFQIELVITVFMILSGINFSLYYYFLKGERKVFFKDVEFRTYIAIIITAITLITLHLTFSGHNSFFQNLRDSLFQVVSIQTTTGYGTADFEGWTSFSQLILLILMFIGGCAGSTGGGMKVLRWIIVFKYIGNQIQNVFRPHAVLPVKLREKAVHEELVKNVMGLFCLWLMIFGFVSLVLAAMGLDLITALTATVATLNNIGPGLGEVGPTNNFAAIPEAGKALLIVCMLFGRLEIYTLIILFLPSFWRR